jgi:hypothetical protein
MIDRSPLFIIGRSGERIDRSIGCDEYGRCAVARLPEEIRRRLVESSLLYTMFLNEVPIQLHAEARLIGDLNASRLINGS